MLLREPLENGCRLGGLLLLGEANAQRVEHIRSLRRLGMIAKKFLPGGDRLVAATTLPECLATERGGLGRLRVLGCS